MSYTSGFFDAMDLGGGNYDRVYDASVFAHYFSLFIKNGVFPDPSTGLQVIASSSPDMHVTVQPGSGWINGYYITVPDAGPEVLTVPTANPSLSRIDSVVLGLNMVDREIKIYVRSGAVSSNPSPVSLQRDGDIYELELAQITVAAGAGSIAQASIKDTRQDSSRCGIVSGTVEQIDVTNLFAQYDDAFHTWFEDLQEQLSGDVATNLQNQINALQEEKLSLSGGTMTGAIDMGSRKITNLAAPSATTDAARLAEVNKKLNLSGGTMTGYLTLNSDPTSAKHAATKQYIDNLLSSLKSSVSYKQIGSANLASVQDSFSIALSESITTYCEICILALGMVASSNTSTQRFVRVLIPNRLYYQPSTQLPKTENDSFSLGYNLSSSGAIDTNYPGVFLGKILDNKSFVFPSVSVMSLYSNQTPGLQDLSGWVNFSSVTNSINFIKGSDITAGTIQVFLRKLKVS